MYTLTMHTYIDEECPSSVIYGDLQYRIAGNDDKIRIRCLEGISENLRYTGNCTYDFISCPNLSKHPLDFKV